LPEPEAYAYTDGASSGSRGPGGYGAVLTWNGKTEEISGSEQNTTNLRMEITAACFALETIDEGGARRDRLLRLVLPRQLHEEGLV
jgi:ribonuclease HI